MAPDSLTKKRAEQYREFYAATSCGMKFKLITWNVRELSNKEEETEHILNQRKADIAVLTETIKKESGTDVFENFTHLYEE